MLRCTEPQPHAAVQKVLHAPPADRNKVLTSATGPRNLRTGTPFWLADGCPRISTVHIDEVSRSTDVIIIGGGVTGAMMRMR